MSLSKTTRKYIGKSPENCNCMQLIFHWFSDLGVKLPDNYKGLDLHNHVELWKKSRKDAAKIMFELFKTLGKETDIRKIKRHDLLAVGEIGNVFAAIAIGSNTAITSNINVGVRVFRLGQFKKVIMARRLL